MQLLLHSCRYSIDTRYQNILLHQKDNFLLQEKIQHCISLLAFAFQKNIIHLKESVQEGPDSVK